MGKSIIAATLSPAILLASCAGTATGDSQAAERAVAAETEIQSEEFATFDEPWALAFAPGTSTLFVTQKAGAISFVDTKTRRQGTVSGVPEVDYGGQGGLGDIAFLPGETGSALGRRTIYLSWAEAGQGDTRGAVVGRGTLVCNQAEACAIEGLKVIWRQTPKVTGRGHYSHRIAFSPDGQYLFISSGDRQKMQPAQDTSNNLGTIVRLNPDGTPAAGNPLADRGGLSAELWSWGHRNVLGLQFDAQGRLWDLEHGPAGGDELNLVKKGSNYGWPLVSDGEHYDGKPIPPHASSDEFAKPAISWNPVIAPGDFIFYSGDLFPAWKGQAIIAAMKPAGLVRVAIDGESAREVGRMEFDNRLRDVVQGPDGAIWVVEDRDGAALLRLTPG